MTTPTSEPTPSGEQAPAPAATRVVRHPIRGAVAGLVLGIGLALLGIGLALIALGTLTPIIVIVACTALGVILAMVVPPFGRQEA